MYRKSLWFIDIDLPSECLKFSRQYKNIYTQKKCRCSKMAEKKMIIMLITKQ